MISYFDTINSRIHFHIASILPLETNLINKICIILDHGKYLLKLLYEM